MKHENEKLQINKNNYKGYTKLYDTYFFGKKDEPRIMNIIIGDFIISTIGIGGVLYSPIPILFGGAIVSSVFLTVGSIRDIIFEKQSDLQKRYPDLNTRVSKQELEEALEEVGIVTIDSHGYSNINTKNFENKLQQYEELAKNYLEDQRLNYYSHLECTEYTPEERVKVNVKKRERKYLRNSNTYNKK